MYQVVGIQNYQDDYLSPEEENENFEIEEDHKEKTSFHFNKYFLDIKKAKASNDKLSFDIYYNCLKGLIKANKIVFDISMLKDIFKDNTAKSSKDMDYKIREYQLIISELLEKKKK